MPIKNTTKQTSSLHKGYNEKNPGQPQGAFKAASMKMPIDLVSANKIKTKLKKVKKHEP